MISDELLQTRFREFLQNLHRETGQAPIASIVVIHWTTETQCSQAMAPVAKETMFTMLSTMSRKLSAHIESLRAKVRVHKNPSAS